MKITLYYRSQCPFCRKVLSYLEEEGIKVPMKELSKDPNVAEELQAIGGKSQVPCLVIDGKALYESDHIVEWFKANIVN